MIILVAPLILSVVDVVCFLLLFLFVPGFLLMVHVILVIVVFLVIVLVVAVIIVFLFHIVLFFYLVRSIVLDFAWLLSPTLLCTLFLGFWSCNFY